MYRVQERINLAQIGEEFKDWADTYFHPESGNLDKVILKSTAQLSFDPAYEKSSRKISPANFKKKLRTWVSTKDYLECLNPKELTDKTGRIMRKVDTDVVEHIYIKTIGTAVNPF